jgi:hypothetical protein
MNMTKRQAIASAKRAKRRAAREQKLIALLIEALQNYMSLHYGNPATGRAGAILDGPVIARLAAAATLRALLMGNQL